jgi:rubrerythrin
MKSFEQLTEREILALAISLEEEDERVYADFAEGLRENFPASAAVCEGMRTEESGHRRRLIELYQEKFGDHIPANPAAGCARICAAEAGMAGAAAGTGNRTEAGQRD